MFYELIPNMPQHRLLPLMQRFAEMLVSSGLFGRFYQYQNEGMDEYAPFKTVLSLLVIGCYLRPPLILRPNQTSR